jgi:ferrous iron transport protein A
LRRNVPMTLDKLPLGQEAVITAVGGEGALRCRLLDMGLIPKTRVRVEKVAPLGDPLELRVRGYSLSLRKEDAGKIEVEVAGT